MKFDIQGVVELNVSDKHAARINTKWDPFNNMWRDRDGPANEMRQFLHHAKGLNTLIDVGANMGVFSLTFAALNPGAAVWSIEPLEEVFDILKDNIAENPDVNITPIRKFFGSETGMVAAEVDCHGYYNVTSDVSQVGEEHITSLDEFVEKHEIVPDAIKVDVEGYEVDVLRGSLETLKKHRPVLFLETHLEILAASNLTGIATYGYDRTDLCNIVDEIEYNVYNFGRKVGDGIQFLQWMNSRSCPADRLVCLPRDRS